LFGQSIPGGVICKAFDQRAVLIFHRTQTIELVVAQIELRAGLIDAGNIADFID
jgi:hypothetical protein